jgi:hypothetical protein
MKNSYSLWLGTALAAVLAVSSMGTIHAEDRVPNSGEINPGITLQAPSQSADFARVPTPDEARAALMTPVSKQPSTGDASAATTGTGAQERQGTQNASAANEPPPSGPIGSVGETIPAKFSKRNDILDHVPIMAIPLPLTDEQRRQIYDAVMADKSQPVAGAEALEPASELSPDQALNGMHPMPASVRGIDGVARLYYIKAKGKVLLVEPAIRTVVEQILS